MLSKANPKMSTPEGTATPRDLPQSQDQDGEEEIIEADVDVCMSGTGSQLQ
jgi:hypothetical protein